MPRSPHPHDLQQDSNILVYIFAASLVVMMVPKRVCTSSSSSNPHGSQSFPLQILYDLVKFQGRYFLRISSTTLTFSAQYSFAQTVRPPFWHHKHSKLEPLQECLHRFALIQLFLPFRDCIMYRRSWEGQGWCSPNLNAQLRPSTIQYCSYVPACEHDVGRTYQSDWAGSGTLHKDVEARSGRDTV